MLQGRISIGWADNLSVTASIIQKFRRISCVLQREFSFLLPYLAPNGLPRFAKGLLDIRLDEVDVALRKGQQWLPKINPI